MHASRTPPERAGILSASRHALLTISSDPKLNHLIKHKIKKTTVFKGLPGQFI
jgi:hypothetical protein